MPRIDIELTSSRPDGTWTWRAAGARQPKGVVSASVLQTISWSELRTSKFSLEVAVLKTAS